MSYESFDGGSHGTHQWVALGHERVPQWDDSRAGPIPDSTSYRMAERLPDKWYIVRACQLCTEVWWQEYDVTEAVAP